MNKNKKFSIVNTLDLEKLIKEIEEYICITGEENPYIFMNDDTIDAILHEMNKLHYFGEYYKVQERPTNIKYSGHPVFQNNALKFGEIEIR